MLELFRCDQKAENFMIDFKYFASACLLANRLPWIDICSDTLGTNSLCPYFLSAEQDSITADLTEFDIFCNPPYKCFGAFVQKLQKTKSQEATTQALLIIPVEKSSSDEELRTMFREN